MASRKKKQPEGEPEDDDVFVVLAPPKLILEPTKVEAETKPAPEPRMTSLMRGAKLGMMKGGAEQLSKAIAGPIKDKIVPALKASFPGAGEILGPAVELAIEVAVILGIAEMMALLGGLIPGDKKQETAERGQAIAQFLREYAGEKAASHLVEAAMAAIPLIMHHFSEISTAELKEVVGIETPTETEQQTEPAFAEQI